MEDHSSSSRDRSISIRARLAPLTAALCIALASSCAPPAAAIAPRAVAPSPPVAAARASEDPLLPLETPSEETRRWERIQNQRTTDVLHAHPQFEDMLRRVHGYRDAERPPRQVETRGPTAFALEELAGTDAMVLFRREAHRPPVPLFRTDGGDAAKRTNIDFAYTSRTGHFSAVGISEAGFEETELRILDERTGAPTGDVSADVRNGQVVWLPDDSGYLYMRGRGRRHLPVQDQIRDLSVALHRLGTRAEDDIEIVGSRAVGPRISSDYEYCYPNVSLDGHTVTISVRHGLNPDLRIFSKPRERLLDPSVPWERVYDETARVTLMSVGRGRLLVVRPTPEHEAVVEAVSLNGPARRKILYASDQPIEELLDAGDGAAYVVVTDRVGKHLLHIDGSGVAAPLPLPPGTSIRTDSVRLDPLTGRIVFEVRSWTARPAWWSASGSTARPLQSEPTSDRTASADAIEVRELEAPASDGEQIPITVVRSKREGPLSGFVWVSAYGAYGRCIGPSFTVARRILFDLGGTYVVAHVRGGGEKGRAWYEAGRGVKKKRTVDDTIDALRYLRAEHFGEESGLLLLGASAGGIPAGGVLTRAPDLVDAVFIESGVLNVSRMEAASAIGAIHKEEYGTADTPEGARLLREIDAYENVKDGVAYPAVYLLAARNDARVPYWGSSKLAARLLQATSGHEPIFLRLTGGGHVSGSTAEEEAFVDAELLVFALERVHKGAPR